MTSFYVETKGKKRYKSTYRQNRNRLRVFEHRLIITKGNRWGRDRLGVENWHMHTEVYGMIGQQGPDV